MISVKHLTKRYGDHTAVSDLSFEVEQGKIYGFLGPNGAGKSTTMNIMTGCLAASEGEVTIDGYDIFEDAAEAKRRIGYLPEQPPLYLDSTPKEYLTFVARAKGVKKAELSAQVENAMAVTGLEQMADRLIKNLSKGYKQRVGIAQAILGNPEVVILDEPTVGLDPAQMIEIRQLIRSLGEKHTVILSSHILSEVRAVCDIILIISKGKLVACDTPDNLEELFAGKTTVTVLADGTEDEAETLQTALSELETVESVTVTAEKNSRLRVVAETPDRDSTALCRSIFRLLAAEDRPILQMTTGRATLEDVFIELTSTDQPEPEAATAEAPAKDSPAEEKPAEDSPAEPSETTEAEEEKEL